MNNQSIRPFEQESYNSHFSFNGTIKHIVSTESMSFDTNESIEKNDTLILEPVFNLSGLRLKMMDKMLPVMIERKDGQNILGMATNLQGNKLTIAFLNPRFPQIQIDFKDCKFIYTVKYLLRAF